MASTKKSSLGNVAPWAEPAWNSIPSPYYNESHKQLRNGLRAYIDENILPNALEWEEAGDVPKEEKFKWLNSGFSANDIPVEYRPKNFPLPAGIPLEKLDAFHLLVSTDETSRVPAGGVMTAMSGANVIGAPPVIHWGTKEQKDRWLPGMFNWTTNFCLGITEPDAGSDVAQLKTTAEKTPDGKFYIVNGYKKWITGAPYATHMTTAVRTSGPGMAGLSVLVIPMNSQGLSHRRIPNSGQKAGGASFIELDNVKVPADHLIGKEGQGFKIIMKNFNRERYVMAVGCNRRARDCMSDAFAYANKRHTFGKPLITNQVIRAKIARIARDVESHWAWLETIAYAVNQSPDGWESQELAGRLALAKVMGGKLLEKAAREAQQIFGGAGYQRGGVGGNVEQTTRDLRMMVVGGGSEEILNDLAVRQEVINAMRRGWSPKL